MNINAKRFEIILIWLCGLDFVLNHYTVRALLNTRANVVYEIDFLIIILWCKNNITQITA